MVLPCPCAAIEGGDFAGGVPGGVARQIHGRDGHLPGFGEPIDREGIEDAPTDVLPDILR